MTVRNFLPTPDKLRAMKALRPLGERIYHPKLWHLSRASAATGVAAGLFVTFVPLPVQMPLACLLAMWLRCHLPLAVTVCWISNPLTYGPMFWFAHQVGAFVLDIPPQDGQFELSWEWLGSGLAAVWRPFLLGCLLCACSIAGLGYVAVRLLWRWRR